MKKYFLIFIVLSQILFSQNWKDRVFDNVILIKDENVIQKENLFLIDIPLNVKDNEKLILYNASHIPNKLFFEKRVFLPQIEEFILISPDKEYYKSVGEFAKNIKGCAEPIQTDKFYFVKRNELKWDSVSVNSSNYPKINFKNNQIAKNEVISYFSEYFGSVCCPRDQKREFLKDGKNQIFFEELKNKGITIKETYSCSFGKEGEYAAFYPLKEFSSEQKLTFIKERLAFLHEESDNYQIFFPETISYPSLKLNKLN